MHLDLRNFDPEPLVHKKLGGEDGLVEVVKVGVGNDGDTINGDSQQFQVDSLESTAVKTAAWRLSASAAMVDPTTLHLAECPG